MSTDYRYSKPPPPAPVSDDTAALINALNTGWIGRGFAMAVGFFAFGLLVSFVVWLFLLFAGRSPF